MREWSENWSNVLCGGGVILSLNLNNWCSLISVEGVYHLIICLKGSATLVFVTYAV